MKSIISSSLRILTFCLLLAFVTISALSFSFKNAEQTFGIEADKVAKSYTVQQISCSAKANVFWPGDAVSFKLQFVNKTDQALKAAGKVGIINYSTTCDPYDGWQQYSHKIADCGSVPVTMDIAAKGYADIEIKSVLPKRFGAYALVADIPGQGRCFITTFLYTPKATPGKVQNPTYALDLREYTPEMCGLWQRIGIKGTRNEWGYRQTKDGGLERMMTELGDNCKTMADNDITAMLCIEGGDYSTMPLGTIRSLLNDKDEGKMDYPGDFVWQPKYDEDFQKWTTAICSTYGWPKGPINAVELWNEPWEGSSISGWGADLPRYRELYTKMALGVLDAREKEKVKVLIGGTCSSMNTEDKLFGDGKDTFLPWLDFTSIHYQPMGNVPAIIPSWVNRKSEFGAVQPWDTESWVANSEDRVAAIIASMRAQGLKRTAGVLHDAVRDTTDITIRTATGNKRQHVVVPYACGAGIAACQAFIGERDFKEILFKNGLPWVFVFDGLPGKDGKKNPDDGTVVLVGDLAADYYYEKGIVKFEAIRGMTTVKSVEALNAQLAALPADATTTAKADIQAKIKAARELTGATFALKNNSVFILYDYNGNQMPAAKGKLTVPLTMSAYFLRTNGKRGTFAKLIKAITTARIDGYQPVEIKAHDMTARLNKQPNVQLTLTNILNRPVIGTLTAKLGALTLNIPTQTVKLNGNETKTIAIQITGGNASADNVYPLSVRFDAGKDGYTTLNENMHVNVICQKTITVDGKLDDWNDVLPQIVKGKGSGPNLTEKAWLPFVQFPDKSGIGLTVAYLAYDANNFYFAAKVADSTPNGGELRYSTRDDDQYYYPEKSYRSTDTKHEKPLVWPQDVRRFSYRKNPDIPMSDDGIQIAFNVLPTDKKDMIEYPPGTMPQFQVYKDTDYEYYLHAVGNKWFGGTEIWRLLAPGVPRKHFYPRQPKADKDGGPVENGKLAVIQGDTTRIVECALPWSEIPDVKSALDSGKNIKFTFRVTDDKGPSYEMVADRSLSKHNALTFHPLWETHWSNEVEFAFEK
jgi:hypothetical protein